LGGPTRPVRAQRRAQVGPDEALNRLMEGNQRFVDDILANPNQSAARRVQISAKQEPFAAILGCADSRLPPELIFDQGLGDLFVARVAGNVVTDELPASLEYAATVLKVQLIMVLGHTRCGAIQAAVDVNNNGTVLPGTLPSLVRAIQPAIAQTRALPGDPVDN